MIWDSEPWKRGLLIDAHKLTTMNVADEVVAVEFEKTMFVAGLAIRKLLEAKKLTDRVANLDIKCSRLPLRVGTAPPDLGNWYRVDQFYDNERASVGTIKLKDFANQLLHSFVFGPMVADERGQLIGFIIASDRDKGKFLFKYDIGEVVSTLRRVGEDVVVTSAKSRDANNEWIVHNHGSEELEQEKKP